MKKKFSIWLNIVTICLCFAALAIGVYAATSASLTISGQIGFTAHGVEFTATAKAKGYAESASATTYVKEFSNPISMAENKITLPAMYFSDLVESTIPSIVIEISITNGSSFPVEAMLSLPTTTALQENITFDVENGLAQMGDKDDTDTKTQTITITMTLKNAETAALQTPQAFDFNIQLNKYTQIKGDATGYYMTMGSNVVTTNGVQQVEPVKWIPFAVNNGTAEQPDWAPFVNTTKPDSSKEHYYISEKVLDITGTGAYDNGVPFNPFLDSNDGTDTRESLTNQNANIYLTSNIRDLLQGEDAYATANAIDDDAMIFEGGTEKVNLLKEYGITGYVYEKSIIVRKAQDLYGSTTIPASLSAYNTDNDKLWLLSGEELNYLLNDETFDYDGWDDDIKLITPTFRGAVNSYWWLRSPSSVFASGAWCVDGRGFVDSYDVNDAYGVRPAFKI